MKETWWFVDTGFGTPAYNMAMDEALLNWQSRGGIPPVLRFYGWEPAGISVGFFQKVAGGIDTEYAARLGIPIVRRLTGGQAVLHERELTYSVFVPETHPAMPKTVKEAYLVLSQGLLEGYRELGIPAQFATPSAGGKSSSAICFEKPSWYEMTIDGKKAAGSAQTRKGGVILQHGSVPLAMDEGKLFDLFVYPDERTKEQARQAFRSRAVAINDYFGEEVDLATVKGAFRQGFEKGLDIELRKVGLPAEVAAEVEQLVKKYESDEWKFLREQEGERV